MNRRAFLQSLAASGLSAALPWPARALQEAGASGFEEVTAEQAEAIRRGLDFLARQQSSSGTIGRMAPVAVTSLAALSFMAGGSTPTRGPYATNVLNALRFVLRCVRPTGYLNEGGGRAQGGSGMHGHGYALLFLAELYGMCGELQEQLDDESVREAIVKAVKLTEYAQDPNGGWGYEPNPDSGHEGSVTITQVQALRSARNAGIQVSQRVIDKGISYIKKSTAADGTILYSLSMGGSMGGSYALTAAGACVYGYYGIYDDPQAEKCVKALYDFLAGRRRPTRDGGFMYYGHFYGAQACFFMKRRDPKYWREGYDRIRRELLSKQNRSTGAWSSDGTSYADDTYSTACATLVLQIPYRLLPILQD